MNTPSPFQLLTGCSRSDGIQRLSLRKNQPSALAPLQMTPGAHALLAADDLFFSTHDLTGNPTQASGVASSWRITQGSTDPIWLGSVPTHGQSPNSVALSPSRTRLAITHFRGISETGSLAILPVAAGTLGAPCARLEREPRAGRVSHLHSVRFLSENLIAVADFGRDEVFLCEISGDTVREVFSWHAPENSGPRTLAMLSGERLALTTQTDSTLIELRYSIADRTIEPVQAPLPLLPSGWNGKNSASDCVACGQSGWVYAGNRGHDSIACFRTDSGRLVSAGHFSCGGRTPRGLAISADESFLAATLEGENRTDVFSLPPGGGLPTTVVASLPCPSPVTATFLNR